MAAVNHSLGEFRIAFSTTKLFVDITNRFVDYAVSATAREIVILMAKKKLPRPTDSELAILRVLWRRGPSTVREVHTELNQKGDTGYTTILKLMQIMTQKGLIKRDESQRTHVCSAVLRQEEAQHDFLGDLLDRLFNGSAAKLVLQALSKKKASPSELAQIRKLLDELEGRG
jgi:BlaI family transcriptional regulator, penicillinase repressor